MKSHNSENIQKADIIKVNKKRVVILFFESKKRIDQRTSRGKKLNKKLCGIWDKWTSVIS